ncbi:MAG: hypothetical protein ABUL68_04965 [Pseudomonadota bacterium]
MITTCRIRCTALAIALLAGVFPAASAAIPAVEELYVSGVERPADAAAKFKLVQEAAQEDSSMAWTVLGIMYIRGIGTPPNEAEGVSWLKKAVDPDHHSLSTHELTEQWLALLEATTLREARAARAFAYAGAMSEEGEIDGTTPKSWLEYAAELGHPEARRLLTLKLPHADYRLAMEEYQAGISARKGKKYSEAYEHLRKAVEAGNAYAMIALAKLYREGHMPSRLKDEVLPLLRKAGEAGLLCGYVQAFELELDAEYDRGFALYAHEQGAEALKVWQGAMARGGNALTALRIAALYEEGAGVKADEKQALAWYERARALGYSDVDAPIKRTKARFAGLAELAKAREAYQASRMPEAIKWFEAAAAAGNMQAMAALGKAYRDAEGVKEDLHKAHEWYMKAAALGDGEADIAAGAIEITLKNPKPVAAAPKPEAPKPAPVATPPPEKKALTADDHWKTFKTIATYAGPSELAYQTLKDAVAIAETGSPETKMQLADVLVGGSFGIPKDEARGVALLAAAANEGFAPAKLGYAQVLLAGAYGVAKDEAKAKLLLTDVVDHAEDAAPTAKHQVALILFQGGLGFPADRPRALRLLQNAAEWYLPESMYEYGRALMGGVPPELPADPAKGIKWLKQAANVGHPMAAAALGEIHERGMGIPANPAEAIIWYEKAAKGGVQGAQAAADRLKAAPAKQP